MKIFRIDKDRYLKYDEGTDKVKEYNLPELVEELRQTEEFIGDDLSKDEKKLLKWAKVHYPYSTDAIMRDQQLARIEELKQLIAEIEAAKAEENG